METLKYKSLSFPRKIIDLPKEAVEVGNDFIEKIKKSNSKEDLIERIDEHDALRHIAENGSSLLRRANYIMSAKAESPRKKAFIDHIYVRLGEYYSSGKRITEKYPKLVQEIDLLSLRLYNNGFN